MRLYYLIAQKNYRINLQYRFTQLINAFGSALFGYIMVFVWQAAAKQKGGFGEFTTTDLMLWVAFAQILFNFVYPKAGLGIQLSVRSGNISLEFLRPINYFCYVMARETGRQVYNLVYRCIPILILYSLTVGYKIPSLKSIFLLIIAMMLGEYISLCLCYIVGITALWTTDVRWSHLLYFSILNVASGVMIPVSFIPGLIGKVLYYSPWACLLNPSCRIFLGVYNLTIFVLPIFWSIALTFTCLLLTKIGKRKLEVQGG
ncbi:ABC-2 family transporter protein [Clostridium sp. 'deep sea']|uniref:ABC transporter permease n=1 Tax=Clostridium sp. 'deep sea' TaxID=2779445 RepID=UPI0018966DD2|nr:ABC-2 family transporter protein [Clostridium sp. 'deep sea']QOR34014.1 ABC-2 family transporter protein [Clostridium sp. 'deep sea']